MENAAGRPARLTSALVRRADPDRDSRAPARTTTPCWPASWRSWRRNRFAPCHRARPRSTSPRWPATANAPSPLCSSGASGHSRSGRFPTPCSTATRFAELEPLRAGLLALPVHQALSDLHMERVVEAARAVLL